MHDALIVSAILICIIWRHWLGVYSFLDISTLGCIISGQKNGPCWHMSQRPLISSKSVCPNLDYQGLLLWQSTSFIAPWEDYPRTTKRLLLKVTFVVFFLPLVQVIPKRALFNMKWKIGNKLHMHYRNVDVRDGINSRNNSWRCIKPSSKEGGGPLQIH